MIFYSGFSFTGEANLFKPYLFENDYCIAGFSYGAIKAVQEVAESTRRIDRLQLLSPVFFQDKPVKFKRLQIMGYNKDSAAYLEEFRKLCFAPYEVISALHFSDTNVEQLHELLEYIWEPKLLEAIRDRGVRIDVYLGGEDRIINADTARQFFEQYATVHLIKKANHFLLEG